MGVTRSDFTDAGLQVLGECGFPGLKLAEVCRRLQVTSGAFYHQFHGWTEYRLQLIECWKREATTAQLAVAETEADPRRRIERLIDVGVNLNHRAEAAIRAWSSIDPDVRAVQVEVDTLRHWVVYESACEITPDLLSARRFADCAVLLLIGYQQATLPGDPVGLRAIFDELFNMLDSTAARAGPGLID